MDNRSIARSVESSVVRTVWVRLRNLFSVLDLLTESSQQPSVVAEAVIWLLE